MCSHPVNNNCKNLGGSFSAEHGVGRLKVKDLKQYCDPGKFNIMCQIKKAIDPFAILNPGVILKPDPKDIQKITFAHFAGPQS